MKTLEWTKIRDTLSPLDGGGEGQVYRGMHDGVPVVVKLESLSLQLLEIIEEIRGFVKVVGVVEHEGEVMGTAYEACDGAVVPPVSKDALLGLFQALLELHARGHVHGDVHPGNVLSCGRSVVLSDFGLARAIGTPMTGHAPARYASPAQLRGERAAPHMDVHSWVLASAYLLTGVRPWDGWTEPRIILAKDTNPVPPEFPELSRFLDHLPETPSISWASSVLGLIQEQNHAP